MKQLLLCLVLLASGARAQCPPGMVCPVPPGWPASQPNIRPAGVAAKSPQPAVVRVIGTTAEGPWLGTGVLIRPPKECKFGVVLTANHVIPPRPDSVVVVFHDCRVPAIILGRDASLDLAVLSIPRPRTKPYEIATEPPQIDDALWAGGYAGPRGRFQTVSGNFLHYGTPDDPPGPEKSVLMLAGSVEQGVSGGPITDYRGRLVGIVSSTDDEFVFGTHCVFIREFLNRILSPATPKGMSPMNLPSNGSRRMCPEEPPIIVRPPAVTPPNTARLDVIETRLKELLVAIEAIPAGAQGERGEPGSQGVQGEVGPTGQRGEAGEQGTAATVSLDDLVAEVLERLLGTDDEEGLLLPWLPPIPMRLIQMKRGADGEWVPHSEDVDAVYFSRGEGITIRLFPPE